MTTPIEIKKYVNKYGNPNVDCPVCGATCFYKGANPLTPLKRHIKNAAKDEALLWMLTGGTEEEKLKKSPIPHLSLFEQHFKEEVVPVMVKRNISNESFKVT